MKYEASINWFANVSDGMNYNLLIFSFAFSVRIANIRRGEKTFSTKVRNDVSSWKAINCMGEA